MRVICGSLEEFLSELDAEAGDGRVWQKVVRLRIERVPEQKDQTSFEVAFIGTALIGGQHPEYLLEFVGWTGIDGRRPNDGTKTAEDWQSQVKTLCEKRGLKLRRGKLEIG